MVNTSISISKEVYEHIKKNPNVANFSKAVEHWYRNTHMTEESASQRLERLEQEKEEIKRHLQEIQENPPKEPEEIQALRVWMTKADNWQRVNVHGVGGVRLWYNNEYQTNITEKQFRTVYDEIRKED